MINLRLPVVACFVAVILSVLGFSALHAETTALPNFSIKPDEWQKFSPEEKKQFARAFKPLSAEKEKIFDECVNERIKEPKWAEVEMGTVMTQCLFDNKLGEDKDQQRRDVMRACIQKKIPDFSDKDYMAVWLAFIKQGVETSDGEAPTDLDPKAKKVLEAMKDCEKNGVTLNTDKPKAKKKTKASTKKTSAKKTDTKQSKE